MINCTLTSLIFASLYNASPFLMMPLKNQISTHLIISNFHCSKFFSNFYFSAILNKQITSTIIRNSHFSNFLSLVIFLPKVNINENNIKVDQIFEERQVFSGLDNNIEKDPRYDNSIIINKCVFKKIESRQNNGGCIFSEANLVITESIFLYAYSKNGCVYCNNSHLSIFSTSFQSCTSQQMSSCFSHYYTKPKNNIPLVLSSINFLDSKSYNLFGIFYISSPNPVSIINSNITNCGASQCVGSFEISNSALFIRHTNFNHSYAGVHNGCIVLRNANKFLIEYSTFFKCQQTTTLTETGCNLLIYSAPADSLIKNTAFIESKPSKGFSITAVTGIELTFESCFFSFPKDVEINPYSSYLCIFSNTIFECQDIENNKEKNIEIEETRDPKANDQCAKIKDGINRQISESQIKSNLQIKQRLNKNKFNDKYLIILFEYDSKVSFTELTSTTTSLSLISILAERIAKNSFFVSHKIQKKHITFFFIYIMLLVCGLLLLIVFELLIRKYPSLCVIKPNKGGFMQMKTPHAIL